MMMGGMTVNFQTKKLILKIGGTSYKLITNIIIGQITILSI